MGIWGLAWLDPKPCCGEMPCAVVCVRVHTGTESSPGLSLQVRTISESLKLTSTRSQHNGNILADKHFFAAGGGDPGAPVHCLLLSDDSLSTRSWTPKKASVRHWLLLAGGWTQK